MNQLNNNTSVFKPLERKQKDKANTIFLKLYAKLNKPKNPFDEARTFNTPAMSETKPEPDFA